MVIVAEAKKNLLEVIKSVYKRPWDELWQDEAAAELDKKNDYENNIRWNAE